MKAHAVGINHVAVEVGDVGAAIEFYGHFLDFKVDEKNDEMAIIYFGDQFINFIRNTNRKPDQMRHFGIAVDDKSLARKLLEEAGVKLLDSRFLDFLDPWGNRVEITTYTNIQYTKADHVLEGMGLGHLKKSDAAISELRAKGMAPRDN
jgi:extradiol dioxygenase family protein